MCKPKPGPRCAHHTRSKMETAQQTLRALHKKADDLAKEDLFAAENRQALEETVIEIQKAETDVKNAERAYWTTPEGQAFLRERIELTEDINKKGQLQAELLIAEKKRATQQRMWELSQRAITHEKEAKDSTLESITDDEKNIGHLSGQILEARQQVTAALASYKQDRAKLEEMDAVLGVAEEDTREAHDRFALAVRDEYVRHGVPRESAANHYAKDAVESMRGDVLFHMTPDGKNPIRTMKNEFTLKSSSPQAAAAVAAMREKDSPVSDTLSKVYVSHNKHQAAVNNVIEARKRERDSHAEAEMAIKQLETLEDEESRVKQRLAHKRAALARWGDKESPRLYPVNKGQFVKSSYLEGDGGTNAYVLDDSARNAKVPAMYVRVRGITSSGGEKVLLLEDGSTLDAEQAEHARIVLVKPQEGSARLFPDSL